MVAGIAMEAVVNGFLVVFIVVTFVVGMVGSMRDLARRDLARRKRAADRARGEQA